MLRAIGMLVPTKLARRVTNICGIALPFISAGLGLFQGAEASRASRAAARANIASINRSIANQTSSVNQRFQEESININDNISRQKEDAARAKSVTSVSAGESGIGGKNRARILADIERQEGRFLETMQMNKKFLTRAKNQQLNDIQDTGKAKIESIKAQIVPGPSLFSTALAIAGAFAGADAYSMQTTGVGLFSGGGLPVTPSYPLPNPSAFSGF